LDPIAKQLSNHDDRREVDRRKSHLERVANPQAVSSDALHLHGLNIQQEKLEESKKKL
jgi:hypothetical protein